MLNIFSSASRSGQGGLYEKARSVDVASPILFFPFLALTNKNVNIYVINQFLLISTPFLWIDLHLLTILSLISGITIFKYES